MHTTVFIACSLDGCIARPDGTLDWLTGLPSLPGEDHGFSRLLGAVDAVLMGRKTFETVLGFGEWPYAKPVFVLSDSLPGVPDSHRGRARVIRGSPSGVVAQLEAQGIRRLYVDGGRTIQGFLRADLVDTMVITTVATILGGGIPLFAAGGPELRFRAVSAACLTDDLVQVTWERRR